MHVFAPISTSSPSLTIPICGIFSSVRRGTPSRNRRCRSPRGLQNDPVAGDATVRHVGMRMEHAVRADARTAPMATPASNTVPAPIARARRSRPAGRPRRRRRRARSVDHSARMHERTARPRRFERRQQRGQRDAASRRPPGSAWVGRRGIDELLGGQHRAPRASRARPAKNARRRERQREASASSIAAMRAIVTAASPMTRPPVRSAISASVPSPGFTARASPSPRSGGSSRPPA